MRKNIFLFVLCIWVLTFESFAQNSTLWNVIVNVRQQHFPETLNEPLHATGIFSYKEPLSNNYVNPNQQLSIYYFKSPMVMIDFRSVSQSYSSNSIQEATDKINSYDLSTIAGIDFYKPNDSKCAVWGGAQAHQGIILVYTKQFATANPWIRDYFKITF
ncbi:MAG: hypothetical protein RMJ97_11770 [Raineya sp.]|nr:hypothetical protein [Raineya sp.]MDW8297550.1 hypothetical protein [Raineya sp.]